LCALPTASSCRVPIDGTAFTASSLVILPSLPVPVKAAEQYFFRLIFFLLLEMVFLKLLPDRCFWAGTVVSAFELLLLVLFLQLEPNQIWFSCCCIDQTNYCSTATASPSSAFNVIIPLASAGNSRVALSESTSAIAWSFLRNLRLLTKLQFQLLIDSGDGTFISKIIIFLFKVLLFKV
jgi:hypothetical protein